MRELHVVALSEDGQSVLLAVRRDAKTGTFRVALSGKLAAAVRGDLAREGEQAPRDSTLTPKEIQARLRAGETAEEIATDAGVAVARVERFSGPVFSERQRMIDEVRRAVLVRGRRGPSALPLGEAADEQLAVSAREGSVTWGARREEDGHWFVEVSFVNRGRTKHGRWLWDPAKKAVRSVDPSSAALGHLEKAPAKPHKDRPPLVVSENPPRREAKPAKVVGRKAPKVAVKAVAPKAPAVKAVAPKVPAVKAVAPKVPAVKAVAPKSPAVRAVAPRAVAPKAVAPKVAAKSAAKAPAAKAAAPKTTAARPPAAKASGTSKAKGTPVQGAAVKAVIAKPAATKPAAKPTTKPAATKPAANKPAATKPAANKPAATKPAAARRTPATEQPAAPAAPTPPAAEKLASMPFKRALARKGLRPPVAPETLEDKGIATVPDQALASVPPTTERMPAPEQAPADPAAPPATGPLLRVVPPHVDSTAAAAAAAAATAPEARRPAAKGRASVPAWADVLLGTTATRSPQPTADEDPDPTDGPG